MAAKSVERYVAISELANHLERDLMPHLLDACQGRDI